MFNDPVILLIITVSSLYISEAFRKLLLIHLRITCSQWVIEMLRFRLKELLAEKEFREGRVITMVEVANTTGIHRMTLSKIANHRGYNPTADVLDRLCTYFGCRIEQLVEHLPDSSLS